MYRYVGATPRIFLTYRDAATGGTLLAEPGNVYAIEGSPLPPAMFIEVENMPRKEQPEAEQTELDRMTDESGVDHTESE
jgi:hypothetical protein